jgi:hypothetical protein
MTAYLSDSNIENEIIVVQQSDATQFNRGKLLNVGFVMAEALGCDYVVFHDVDMIPIEADYSYCDHPIHLATDFVQSCESANTLVSICAVSIRSPETFSASTESRPRYEYISEKYSEGFVVSVTTPPEITRYG